jgi:hypothetical protein
MDARAPLPLLRSLYRHGVTQAVLELWIQVLESQASGSMTFHHDTTGHVATYVVSLHGKPQELGMHGLPS